MNHVIHHISKRKRLHQKFETYPSTGFKNFLDKFIYIIGVTGPLLALSQVYKIWYYQNAAGVSSFFFGSVTLFNVVWIVYGLEHKEKPITFMYSLWLIINSLIFVGSVIY